ncbi:hypothetical protein PPSIR1_22656 [Plesiocystis pacifica SIR-1]|uniref:Uncharacterized protein n=1 Tax=Plesiocystis pacifica SIR-1 TaxID=391625 RepID=A6G2F4_9BACT|nr:sporulation protein [Plesiocystis pacifica]EDM79891.1 hypothetical protein PPSIR1_22656 [Plesiocystis pacifica SIR-1]
MGFSDKMRETLGSEGARLQVKTDDDGWAARVSPGGTAEASVTIRGGTKMARVEALVLRVIVRHRNWSDGQGMTLTDAQARELDDRSHLTPAWSRELVSEARVEVGAEVDVEAEREVAVSVPVPEHCDATTSSCTVALLVQADIRGQIDPTVTGKVLVA